MNRIAPAVAAFVLFAAPVSAAADPSGACVRVSWGRYAASGTCIASEGGLSLVVSNNHVFSEPIPDAPPPLASYPLEVAVATLDGKRSLAGVAYAGVTDADGDLALVLVKGELPVAELADDVPPVGTEVWHKGIGSGGGQGRVAEPGHFREASCHFASTATVVPGDSGAGVFSAKTGQVVAVNNGFTGSKQRGAPVGKVRELLKKSCPETFPRLAEKLGAKPIAVREPKASEPKLADPGALSMPK
jgi:hypothetical protein